MTRTEYHMEWFVALDDKDDFPEITDGPYGSARAAMDRLEDMSNPEDYVILSGSFRGAYNEYHE